MTTLLLIPFDSFDRLTDLEDKPDTDLLKCDFKKHTFETDKLLLDHLVEMLNTDTINIEDNYLKIIRHGNL